jgi:hypothetical protein
VREDAYLAGIGDKKLKGKLRHTERLYKEANKAAARINNWLAPADAGFVEAEGARYNPLCTHQPPALCSEAGKRTWQAGAPGPVAPASTHCVTCCLSQALRRRGRSSSDRSLRLLSVAWCVRLLTCSCLILDRTGWHTAAAVVTWSSAANGDTWQSWSGRLVTWFAKYRYKA